MRKSSPSQEGHQRLVSHPSCCIAVEILQQSIGGTETDFVVIMSTKSRYSWNVSYRFSYFRSLREFLEDNMTSELQADFPGVFALSWIMSMQQAQMEERQQQLWEWITELFTKYSMFSRTVRAAISAFFNGASPHHRIEKYLLSPDFDARDDVCDRCYVCTNLIEMKDHPTYVVSVRSVWRQSWKVHYRFNSFRILYHFILERFPKMISFEFPKTHKRSWYGVKLPVKELVERHLYLKFWMGDAIACYPLFPEELQDEMNLFFEGHPKYEPLAMICVDKNGAETAARHAHLAGRFAFCTNPITGVDMLLEDYGLSDSALAESDGRLASSKLKDIVAFLQLPDDLAFEITLFSAVQSKIIFADQLLKWAEVKMSKTFRDSGAVLTPAQENERDEIEEAVEAFFNCVYDIAKLPDDDEQAAPRSSKSGKIVSPGNPLYLKASREQEYSGCQLVAGKVASAFHILTVVEDAVYSAAYDCLEKILDADVSLASYSIIGGKKNSAASVRTATCVSLLGEVSTIGPHLPFIENAESVLLKILGNEEKPTASKIPGSLRYVAAVMKQLMESEKIRVGTEVSTQQLERTRSQIHEAETAYRNAVKMRSPEANGDADVNTVRLGNNIISKKAVEALLEVLSPDKGKAPIRRSTMATTSVDDSPASPSSFKRKMNRRLSADDNTLLRLAHYGANAELRQRSGSLEQDLAGSFSSFNSRKPFSISPVGSSDSHDVFPPSPLLSPRKSGQEKRGSLKDMYQSELQNAYDQIVLYDTPDPDTGEKRLSLPKLLEWDQIQSVLASGDLTVDFVTVQFNKLATRGFFGADDDRTIDADSFFDLMEILESANNNS